MDFWIISNSNRRKNIAVSRLKEKWSEGKSDVEIERRIFVEFPEKDGHRGHLRNEVRILLLRNFLSFFLSFFTFIYNRKFIKNARQLQLCVDYSSYKNFSQFVMVWNWVNAPNIRNSFRLQMSGRSVFILNWYLHIRICPILPFYHFIYSFIRQSLIS